MKICISCDFYSKEPTATPEGYQMVPICKHHECRDPVTGNPMMCGVCRKMDEFCGLRGKHFKEVVSKPVEDAQVIELVEKVRK